MPHLSPTTLTTDEQRLILRATADNVCDHTIISLALGTGLRLAEIVGLDVGDVFAPGGTPRVRVRVRKEIAKGGRAAQCGGELASHGHSIHSGRRTPPGRARHGANRFIAARVALVSLPSRSTMLRCSARDQKFGTCACAGEASIRITPCVPAPATRSLVAVIPGRMRSILLVISR